MALQWGAVLGVCVVVDFGLTVLLVCVVVEEVVWEYVGAVSVRLCVLSVLWFVGFGSAVLGLTVLSVGVVWVSLFVQFVSVRM